jgi:hypothetical protein
MGFLCPAGSDGNQIRTVAHTSRIFSFGGDLSLQTIRLVEPEPAVFATSRSATTSRPPARGRARLRAPHCLVIANELIDVIEIDR